MSRASRDQVYVAHVLELHVPARSEFVVRQRWLADPEMMAFNAGWEVASEGYDRATGCIRWPQEEWAAFELRLRLPSTQHGYFYVRDVGTGAFVGHVHYVVDERSSASIGLNVEPSSRGRGWGVEMLRLLVEYIWSHTDAVEIANEFEDERLSAVRTHQRCGFVPDPRTGAEWGRPTRTWRLTR